MWHLPKHLTDTKVLNPKVYRENPIASFHTQTFSSESDAAAAYEEKKAQKTSYRPGDTVWQKVTLKNNLAALSSGKQAGEEGRLINPVIYDKVPEYFTKTLYDSYGVGDSIPNFHLRLLNADGSEKDLSNIALYLADKTESVNGYDYGGKMTYTDGFNSENATQKAFADMLSVSPAYVGKLLKGNENLTLETICRVQTVIDEDLISIHRPYEYKVSILSYNINSFSFDDGKEKYESVATVTEYSSIKDAA